MCVSVCTCICTCVYNHSKEKKGKKFEPSEMSPKRRWTNVVDAFPERHSQRYRVETSIVLNRLQKINFFKSNTFSTVPISLTLERLVFGDECE